MRAPELDTDTLGQSIALDISSLAGIEAFKIGVGARAGTTGTVLETDADVVLDLSMVNGFTVGRTGFDLKNGLFVGTATTDDIDAVTRLLNCIRMGTSKTPGNAVLLPFKVFHHATAPRTNLFVGSMASEKFDVQRLTTSDNIGDHEIVLMDGIPTAFYMSEDGNLCKVNLGNRGRGSVERLGTMGIKGVTCFTLLRAGNGYLPIFGTNHGAFIGNSLIPGTKDLPIKAMRMSPKDPTLMYVLTADGIFTTKPVGECESSSAIASCNWNRGDLRQDALPKVVFDTSYNPVVLACDGHRMTRTRVSLAA